MRHAFAARAVAERAPVRQASQSVGIGNFDGALAEVAADAAAVALEVAIVEGCAPTFAAAGMAERLIGLAHLAAAARIARSAIDGGTSDGAGTVHEQS